MEAKRTKRVRKQTAVLLTVIQSEIQVLQNRALDWDEWQKLLYYRSLILTTTDHYGTPKNKTKSQGTRLIRAGCSSCGYTIRVSQMWIACGLPKCPNPNCDRKGKPFEVDDMPKNAEYQPFEPEAPQEQIEKPQPSPIVHHGDWSKDDLPWETH